MIRRLRDAVLRRIARVVLQRRVPADLSAGDVCSVASGGDGYGVVKVLAVESETVHVRVYKEKYGWRPERIETAALSLGSIHDPDGFGIGHLPLSRPEFGGWEPVRINREKVADEELEGYRMWQESGGGVWQ